jgi:hypothetical protein
MAGAPILLFDLNGTLVHRDKENGVMYIRPHIDVLVHLARYYRVGVFSSVIRRNADAIIAGIETACGGRAVFDRDLIFTQEHTIPFTKSERERYGFGKYKRKKSLCRLFPNSHIDHVRIVDNEIERIVEKDLAIDIATWTPDMTHDAELFFLASDMVACRSSSSFAHLNPNAPEYRPHR